jgi:O-methyltransferase
MSSIRSTLPGLINSVRKIVRSAGFDLVRLNKDPLIDLDGRYEPSVVETIRAVAPFTLTSPERIAALCDATRYVVQAQIPGDVVECGVWRGGSMMAVARTLIELGDTTRTLFLYDTFSGMPLPGDRDVTISGESATDLMLDASKDDATSIWCYAPLEGVKKAVTSVGYPQEQLRFVEGKVEETIPATAPHRIALLRLDTDWYESTRHELVHLFPKLSTGGILIIDDYGHWKGARQAVDEYVAQSGAKLFLNRIDYTGRVGVKVG